MGFNSAFKVLMYLSRLSGCPKSSQRDAPSSGISLFRTTSNQQVLNLANTEGGRSQSLFVALSLSRRAV